MNIEISRKTKLELFNNLLNEGKLILDDPDEWMNFLDDIWNLRALPSEDSRFSDAYGDVFQHTVNNDDWELEFLFLERLKLLDTDEVYISFLEALVSPKYRADEDDIFNFVLSINAYIEKENCILAISDYDENSNPIHSIIEKTEDHYTDIVTNKIPFYLFKEPNNRSLDFDSHDLPPVYPSFVLVHNSGWNDYSIYSEFMLFFYNEKEKFQIGRTKIIDGENSTIENFPNEFTELTTEYCSLGQEYEYYENLKKVTGKTFESILFSLKDSAFFPEIYEKFETSYLFKKSLIRYDEAEQLLREAKYRIYGFDLSNLYSFKYRFTPKYSKDELEVAFEFNNKSKLQDRIFAIIGKNGAGKTQLITTLPLLISKKNNEKFIPRAPLFSKVIAVSYSAFDNFEIPKKTSSFNYTYCGLLNNKRELLTERQQLLRFHKATEKIVKSNRTKKWKSILLNFVDENILDLFIEEETNQIGNTNLKVNREQFNKLKNQLSSGQSILIYIVSEIISQIRFDTLLLFDEPETHLHPNAISQLMSVIYDLIYEFESYCIIATHSPLVIQELFSKNVFVLEKDNNIASLRKIGIESFGENLSTLTEEVFGNKQINRNYKKVVDRLINKGSNYDEIIDALETDNIPLSLNVRLYIRSRVEV